MLKIEYFSGVTQVYSTPHPKIYANTKTGFYADDTVSRILYKVKEKYKETGRYMLVDVPTWEAFEQLVKSSGRCANKDLLGLVRLNYMIGEQRNV